MATYQEIYDNLLSRLDHLRTKTKRINLLNGLLVFFVVLAGLSLLAFCIEAVCRLPSTARMILLGCTGLIVVGAFAALVLRPIHSLFFRRAFPDNVSLALTIGRHFDTVRDRLADALQLFEKHEANPEGYSLDLADASLLEINKEVSQIDVASVASMSSVKRSLQVFIGGTIVCLLLLLVSPSPLVNASIRLFHPLREFPKYAGLSFEITPGDTEVVKGENVEIRAEVTGAELEEVDLVTKKGNSEKLEHRLLQAQPQSRFSTVIENLRDDLDYFVQTGQQKSQQYSIKVVELPFIRNLQVKLIYPGYSKLGSLYLDENVGDVTALKGSTVEIAMQSNKTVASAAFVFDGETERPLRISGQEIAGDFKVVQSGRYRIRLVDRQGRENATPIEYRVDVQEDQLPLVQITFPGQDVDLGKDMLLPLSIEAQDDFGFSTVRIGYKILGGGYQEGEQRFFKLPLPKELTDEILLNYSWKLSELQIQPEDIVTYFAEAFDNDLVSGPKSSRSLTYHVRFPSVYEIYEEVARSHEESFDALEEMREESEKLREELKGIVQDMKRSPELNWEEKQRVQEAAESQQQMHQELQSVQEKLDEMISRLEQNDLLSPETLEKYREMQDLMQELLTSELKDALRELQKSMEELDPQKLKAAMEQFAASQEDFQKSIERTLNLLKKLQIEQQLDEVVRKTQDLLRRQDEVNKDVAESAGKQEQDKYAREEQGIRKDTGDLSQDLEDLKNRMEEFPTMPQEPIEAAQNQTSEAGLQAQMQKAIQQMQSGDMQGAQQSGQQISQEMQQMLESLEAAKKELSDEEKKAVMQALSRSSHDLLSLSKQQESLRQKSQGMDRNSPGMNETADKQQDLMSGLSRATGQLFELSQRTFFVTPEIAKALGKSLNGMRDARENLAARNSGKAVKGQGEAMSGLNEAVAELRKSMQNMSGASSAIGFQEMMQRLTGMSSAQQGINQQTMDLGNKPGKSMEQQASMSRLAAEQEALRKSVEQLNKEAGNRSELLGDLGQIGKEMEEVVRDLQKSNVSRSTFNRQERILSRLLDAQRSMHNRDYSRKREAETGKQYQALSPQSLPSELLNKKDRLQNELLKALKEGYSKDYRELIRKYFDALSRQREEAGMND